MVGLLSVLVAALSVSKPVPPALGHPAVVRFGALWWIDARGGAPRLQGGQVLVPVRPACDLLGVDCRVSGGVVQVRPVRPGAGQARTDAVPLALSGEVSLRALLRTQPNFTLRFDPAAGAAVVGTRPNIDMIATPWMQADNDWGRQLHNPYTGPLSVRKTRTDTGTSYRLATPGAALNGLTLLSGFPAGEGAKVPSLNVLGALTPSLPDTPNRDAGCGGKPSCAQTLRRTGLWTLAALDAE